MEAKEVRAYFDSEKVVDHYSQAADNLGLWASEEIILTRLFKRKDSLLELGCGVGRVAIGLYELGYRNILATDYAPNMIKQARILTSAQDYAIPFSVCDATELEFEDNSFDGIIFAFNGFMQIPYAAKREQALSGILRVLRPGGCFVFTTHDRERSAHSNFWIAEKNRWETGVQKLDLNEFGDRSEITSNGTHYMHVPTVADIKSQIAKVGFEMETTAMRSELSKESGQVEAFSDDCRFWVVRKPEIL
jgi:ubiquinone/menaquinone biosynthesis C-methylase UbiE